MDSWFKGLNVVNDRPMEVSDGRIDHHIPIVQRNRLIQDDKPISAIHQDRNPSPAPQRTPSPIPPSPLQTSHSPRSMSPVNKAQSPVGGIEAASETTPIVTMDEPSKNVKLQVLEKDLSKLAIAVDVFGESLVALCCLLI